MAECQQDSRCSCTEGWFGDLCDQFGPAMIGLMEAVMYESRAFYFVTSDTILTPQQQTIHFSNEIPCEEFPICSPALLTATTLSENALISAQTPYFPFLIENDLQDKIRNGNMCVHAGNSMNESGWAPSHYFPAVSLSSCKDLGYTIYAQFTNHPSIPDNLKSTHFFLKNPLQYAIDNKINDGLTFSYRCPREFAEDGGRVFQAFDENFAPLEYNARPLCSSNIVS